MPHEKWPYPGDTNTMIARRVALAYRDIAAETAPARTGDLDNRMRAYGQHWVVPRPVILTDPDVWIGAGPAANLAAITTDALRGLRRAGRITGRQTTTGRWEYRIGDVLALAARPRTRNGTQ